MAVQDLNEQRKIQSSLVLANAATLVSNVVQEIAGNDISNSLNGSKITTGMIQTLSLQRMMKRLGAK